MKSVVLNIETQTEDGKVLSICHVNEKSIAIEASDVANKMLSKNRDLFNKINETTEISSGTLYRQEIINAPGGISKIFNKVLNNYQMVETEISKVFFEEEYLKKQIRAITKQGRKIDYDPAMVSDLNSGGYLDEKKLSPDDIKDAKTICSFEEIALFQDRGVKSFLITDFLENKKDLKEVGYRIEFKIETKFLEYVEYVFEKCDKSLLFLEEYVKGIEYSGFYDHREQGFQKEFYDRTMSSLGLTTGVSDLGNDMVRNSQFGQAAISFYNLLTLMSSDTSKNTYLEVMNVLLPTKKTNPANMLQFVDEFKAELDKTREYYLKTKTNNSLSSNHTNIWKVKNSQKVISTISKEYFEIEQEVLGYSIFSEQQTGLNLLSSQDYKRRWASEQAKYYPSIQVEDESSFMTPSEKAQFSRIDNAPKFLTPTQLVFGDEKITTSRGMTNIPPKKIKEFRMAKSARAQMLGSTKYPQSSSKAKITGDVLSGFNLQIGAPKTALLDRAVEQNIDPLVDAKYYIGDNSYFVTNNPQLILKTFKRILSKEDERVLSIVADIVPRRFLRNKRALKSIKELQMSNPKSTLRSLVSTQEITLADLPPQVKYMCSSAFNPNPNSDPLKNSESREIIEETQKNLFIIKALVGFEDGEMGFLDLNAPVYEDMSSDLISTGRPILGKAFDYEVPELGIVKDNFMATIYSNLVYIRG